MQSKYYLSRNGTQVGPYSTDQIIHYLQTGEYAWTDYLWDESKNDWIMLLDHSYFSNKYNPDFEKSRKPQKPLNKIEMKSLEDKLKEKAWYILKEGNNYGPFSKLEIVQMLQEKSLFDHDFIWKADFTAWKHVSEVSEFQPESIRDLKELGLQEVSEVFFRRRHLRAQYGCSVIVHNNKSVFKGQSVEISAGGAGIELDSSNVQPGQNLFLHFKPGDGVPPFNALCLVVSKTTKYNEKNQPFYKYGVKFINISQTVKESIKTYTSQKAA